MVKKPTEEEALEEFNILCRYVHLFDEVGYYVCQGIKSFDTRKAFVLWGNKYRGLKLKK